MLEFNARKAAKVKSVAPDASFSVEDTDGGSFAIASSRKELKALMKSDADVVYDESKGKLYRNDNGTAKGWGVKKVGGLLATFKGKPELSANQFEGLSEHKGNAIAGGGGSKDEDIKDEITSLREGLTDAKVSQLYGKTLIDPKKGLKSVIKIGKKKGYTFNKAELGSALDEMNDAGAFSDIELDAAALQTLLGQSGEQLQGGTSGSSS